MTAVLQAMPGTAAVESFLPYYQAAHRAIQAKTGCAEAAADIMQEAFLRLLRAPPDPDAIREPGDYLQVIAYRLFVDRLRGERRRRRRERHQPISELIAATGPGPQRIVEERELLRLVLRRLGSLSPRCREAFLATRIDGLSYAATAARLGIAESTVEKHIIKALVALRDCLRAAEGTR